MDVVKTFGEAIEKKVLRDPDGARRLLLAGYRAQALALRVHPNGELPPSKEYAAKIVMDRIVRVLSHPESAAMVSLFVPCEPLYAAGLTPYSVETLSGYLAGTDCENVFLDAASAKGIPETLCSFHRIFLGAAETGLTPPPLLMVYTNLACDGNMITFPYLKRKLSLPSYFIDVPYEKSEDAVRAVADELRGMTAFLEEITGRKANGDALKAAVARSARSAELYRAYCACGSRRLTGDLTSEMYLVFLSHILLGTKEAERFYEMLLQDRKSAPESGAKRILWLHIVPYLQPAVRELLNFSDRAFIASCELAYESMIPMDPEKPYESMARRLVYSPYNGSPDIRIARALEMAKLTEADGAVLFAHWGCKGTLGASRLLQKAMEEAGVPTLILDGDGANPANTSDGQMATRLGAFLEMLEAK